MFAFRDQKNQTTQYTGENEITKIYLDVPYDDKNEAKSLGAKWDKDVKKWYSTTDCNILVERWGIEARVLTNFKGEDRYYGGQQLCVEFMPKSCWCKKIQYAVQKSDQTRFCDYVLGRVNRTCETCGLQDTQCNYQIHGRWSYDEETQTQTLVRLMALCDNCYESTHFGTTHFNGRKQEAIAHLKKTNKYTDTEVQTHINDAYESLKQLNQYKWKINLSLLTENGIKCETEKKTSSFIGSKKSTHATKPLTSSKSKKKDLSAQHRAQSEMYAFRNN